MSNTPKVNEATGQLMVGNRQATNEEWQAWIGERRAERGRYRARPSGVVRKTDIETGVILMEGDEGYDDAISQPLTAGHAIGAHLSATDRAEAVRRAQAGDNIKNHEALRYARLVAVKNHQAPPSPVDHGHKPVSKAYAPDLEAHPREATRQAAIAAWGGGTVIEPPTGFAFMAARREREEVAARLRHHEALFTLSATTPEERAKAANPGHSRGYSDLWKSIS